MISLRICLGRGNNPLSDALGVGQGIVETGPALSVLIGERALENAASDRGLLIFVGHKPDQTDAADGKAGVPVQGHVYLQASLGGPKAGRWSMEAPASAT